MLRPSACGLLAVCLAASTAGAAGEGATSAPATASVARGQALYEARCMGCHSVDTHRIGPLHHQVLGRHAGSAPGFDYTPALRNSRITWSARTLDAWLRNPEALVPGQAMNFRVDDAQDRRDLIAYLASLR